MADLIPDAGSIQAPAGLTPDEGSVQAPGEVGGMEALGRGALQGISLGFGDEIQGALQSIFTDKTYQQARDSARQANARAQAAHSTLYGGGEVAGGLASMFVPGLGIAEGAGLGTVAAKSALAGGLGGLGSSEATDVGGIAKDIGVGAALGGAGGAVAHGVGVGIGRALGGAEEAGSRQAVKGIVAGEGKAPPASMALTRKLIDNENVPGLLREDVNGTTLAREAYKPAEAIQPLVEAKQAEIGKGLDEIYDKADAASGGVKVSDLVKHYDSQIAELGKSPINESEVRSLEKVRDSVLKAWAPDLGAALKTEEAANPAVRTAILKSLDASVPSKEVRALATKLQSQGATDETNPALATQIRQRLGSVTRDFVNGHVGNVLGADDRAALEGLNARMSASYAVQNALDDRAIKESAGRISQKGGLETLLGHGATAASVGMLAHGNIPAAAATFLAPKVIAQLPRAGRFATTQAARANEILLSIRHAASMGNPWAQSQIRMLAQTPLGAARLAQLGPTIAAPVDQQSQQEAQ